MALSERLKIVIPGGAPVSPAQSRFDRVVSVLLPTFGFLAGCWEARECSRIAFGYVASYSYATAILLAVAALVFALPLLIHWRSRRLGWALIGFGLVSLTTFYGVMKC